MFTDDVLELIQNNEWEQPALFFQDPIEFNKRQVMYEMSKRNLIFPQIENENDPIKLLELLYDLFGMNDTGDSIFGAEPPPPSLAPPYLHIDQIIACIVSKKSKDVIGTLIPSSPSCFSDKHEKELTNIVVERHGLFKNTALHEACSNNASPGVINALIGIGGIHLVMAKNDTGSTVLHNACEYYASFDIINILIEVGGKDLVYTTDNWKETPLHTACRKNSALDTMIIINKMIEAAGRELVMQKNTHGETALHAACIVNYVSLDIINMLIEFGGRKLLMERNERGNTVLNDALDMLDQQYMNNRLDIEQVVKTLISKGIQYRYNTEEEFEIGGLFNRVPNVNVQNQNKMYERWNDVIVPALEMNMDVCKKQPILHAAIMAKAPPRIIRDIINRFDTIATKDSMDRYPIDIGVTERLKWHNGMQEIVHAFANIDREVPRLMINVGALHGLHWENGMRQITEENVDDITHVDTFTGLYPFMLAAVGDDKCNCDLDSIFSLMIKQPFVLKLYDRHALSSKKRKRV